MGLSDRKEKQRIPADPRNLAWADDAAKFGSNYLAKFGWDSSKGLGVAGEGRTSHIKVSHKLDMLGIGAAHQKDPNGIAWKQNKDFENLLKRLNEAEEESKSPIEKAELELEDSNKGEKKRKPGEKSDASENTTKKRKKEKRKHGVDEIEGRVLKNETDTTGVEEAPIPAKPYVPRYRAHRARVIASKSIASKSAAAISEILGIAPTSTSSATSGSGTPVGKLTSLDDDTTLEKLTTSTKSVADYFKDKLSMKSRQSDSSLPSTPDIDDDRPHEASRGGIGLVQLQNKTMESLDAGALRVGLSSFSSLSSTSFLAATSSLPIALSVVPDEESIAESGLTQSLRDNSHTDGRTKKTKKRRKESDTAITPDDPTTEREGRKRAKAKRKAEREERRRNPQK